MPIPLTPPDDEAWYWYTRLHCHLQGLLLLFYLCNGPPALVVIFDYVSLGLCLLVIQSYVLYDSAFPIFEYPFSV